MTASEAARRLGEQLGSTSYHLRQLARFDLVEMDAVTAASGRGARRRCSTSWPNVADTTEPLTLAEFERFVLGRYLERLERWLARRRTEPEEWQEAASYGDSLLYLTVDELAAPGRAAGAGRSVPRACRRPRDPARGLPTGRAAADRLSRRSALSGLMPSTLSGARRAVPDLLRENRVFRLVLGSPHGLAVRRPGLALALPLVAVLCSMRTPRRWATYRR